MLKITKKVEYALMALKFIWEEKSPGELASAREICEKFQTPFDTTAKVMQAMNNGGVLSSVKGIKGGYTLAKSLNQTTYMELTRMVESNNSESVCQTSKGLCDLYDICNIVTPIDRLNQTLNEYLEALTIQELFDLSFKSSIQDLFENQKTVREGT